MGQNLNLFNRRVKNFFRIYLGSEIDMTYDEIAQRLVEKNKPELAVFCQRMNYYLYSKEEVKEKDIEGLKKHFMEITKGERKREKTQSIKEPKPLKRIEKRRKRRRKKGKIKRKKQKRRKSPVF